MKVTLNYQPHGKQFEVIEKVPPSKNYPFPRYRLQAPEGYTQYCDVSFTTEVNQEVTA